MLLRRQLAWRSWTGCCSSGRSHQEALTRSATLTCWQSWRTAASRRHDFETSGTLFAWDVRVESDGDAARHKWITQDIVKVERGFADAAHSAMRLAEPYGVLVGDASVASRFPSLEAISPDVLDA